MTLITISHLSSPPAKAAATITANTNVAATRPTPPRSLQVSNCNNLMMLNADRLSLNSNLSGSSLQSSLMSPISSAATEEYTGSQASICHYSTRAPISEENEHAEYNKSTNQNNHLLSSHHNHLYISPRSNCNSSASSGHSSVGDDDDIASEKSRKLSACSAIATSPVVSSPPTSPQALSLSPIPSCNQKPARRLSRIEHRQSLSDLGYGKIESYFKLQRLGKGTYATVYMGRSRLSNDLVALKEMLKEHDEGAPCTAIREVSLLRNLRHNNIVTLHDICHTPKKLTLVFEYVGPDLYAHMKENNHTLSIHNVRLLLFQLLRGIAYCHSRQILHRDLKPQNLLINSRGELKICDFGLARAKSIPTKSYSNEVVTLWYRPPDVLLGNTDYDHSIDMWGVGCIFFEMASGRTLFPGSSVRQQLYLIFSCLGSPNKQNWPEILVNPEYQSYNFPTFRPEKLEHRVPRLDADGMNLLMKFLRFRPSERISAEEAKRDPFFSCLPERVYYLNERESIFDA